MGFTICNAFGARAAIKEMKAWPKRLIYPDLIDKIYAKHVPNVEDRNAGYLTDKPAWVFSSLPVNQVEGGGAVHDDEGYWESKRHWQHYFVSGRKDPDNNNRPFFLEEATYTLAANELEAYVFVSAATHSKDD